MSMKRHWGLLLALTLALALPGHVLGQSAEGEPENTCLLLYIARPGGSISGPTPPWRRPVLEIRIPKGGSGDVVSAVPYEGFRFLKWSDGTSLNPRRDVNISKDVKIEAEFAQYTAVPSAVDPADYGFVRVEWETIEMGIDGKTSTIRWDEIIERTTLGQEVRGLGKGEATRNLIGATGPKSLTPPVIEESEDEEDGTVTLKGWWFGPTPRVWREYTVAGEEPGTTRVVRQFLEVLPPDETYRDIEGKNAYQDPATGESKAIVIVPKDKPEGAMGEVKIVLDNGVGSDSDEDPTTTEAE